MAYRALYRVWRPQRFDEIVGQSVITRTLKNALITHQISHAYLFAGPRGTGKTSAAKILAKAVNCPNQKDGEPCNHCRMCKAITAGEMNDVIEIDAASNNGVDEIRNVRDKAHYAPAQAKYKVYIIDEVHMLSTGAFNALLKTLEEPPAHVIFILATTEPQKIPATIISRTQRFNFKRIRPADILKRMEFILHHDHVKFDVRALKVIAKAAEGGMRDALSILDEVLSYGRDHVSYDDALQVTGSVAKELLAKYLGEVLKSNVKSALADAQKLLLAGRDANQFIEQLIDYCQDLLLYQQSPQMVAKTELGLVDDRFKQLAHDSPAQFIYAVIECISRIQEQMRFTTHPDVYLEVLTVKIASLRKHHDQLATLTKEVDQLHHSVRALKTKVRTLAARPTPVRSAQTSTRQRISGPRSATRENHSGYVDLVKVASLLDHATPKSRHQMQTALREVIRQLPVTERAMMDESKLVAASADGMVITFTYSFLYQRACHDKQLTRTLQSQLEPIVGHLPALVFVPQDQWGAIVRNYQQRHAAAGSKNLRKKSVDPGASDPGRDMIKKASKVLGADVKPIIEIKND